VLDLARTLWRGDLPLWKTYWGFGFLGSLFFVAAVTYIDTNSLHFFALSGAASLSWAVRATALGYGVLLWVAIWRSAGKYTGPGVYSGLARTSVVLGILASLGSASQLLLPEVITEQSLRDEAATANRQLPALLGDGIRLDRLTADGMTLIYDYTMINLRASDADVASLRRRTDSVRTGTCLQLEERLAAGVVIRYRYLGSDGGFILSFDVDRESCRQPR
jgi:hypothetical protein